jgi:predicted deacylase
MVNFEIANMSVAPGELKFGSLPMVQMRDSSILSLPLMVMNGKHDGPTLWLDCASHGDEIPGIGVIHRIMREEVKPQDLHGTIVAVPALNIWGFREGSHAVPLSTGNIDLGTVPSYSLKGNAVQRMAYKIFNEMSKCDNIIQFHSNYYPGVEFIVFGRPEDNKVRDNCVALGEAIGLPVCEMAQARFRRRASYQLRLHQQGKTAVTIELLAHGFLDKRSINIGTLGILNALRHLNMLEGEIQPLPDLMVPPGRYGRYTLTSDYGGLAYFQKNAGDWVDTNETIAIIRNLYGDVIGDVKVPMQGYIRTIMFGPHNEAVHEGSIVASVLESDPNRRYFYD